MTTSQLNKESPIVSLRFNPEADEPAREYKVSLSDEKRKRIWYTPSDPQADIAILHINPNRLREHRIKFSFFRSDQNVATREKAKELGITEGDGAFVLGFPLGLVGPKRNFVIVRQGVIARIRDVLASPINEFLIDTTVFPGNSGGPVVLRPEMTAIQGTSAQRTAFLIGVVKGYVAYRETAISEQTKRPRITFEENSGLAAVVPIDYVVDAIQQYLKSRSDQPTMRVPTTTQ